MALPQAEIDRRVALLKRLKNTLNQQREKFHNYMQVLDAEKNSIQADQVETLQAQVALEERLVADIHTFQKVIDPLEEVLKQAYPVETDAEVMDLKVSLESLRVQVLEKHETNRELLSQRMALIQAEIVRLNPKIRGENPYSRARSASTMIDITT